MNEKNVIVGLDVGTTKVCTIVGIQSATDSGSEIEVLSIGSHPSQGLKKGSVINIDKTVSSIRASAEDARLTAGVNFAKATIGIAGSHIYSFNSTGVVAIKGTEITQADVDRVIDAAKAVVIPSDREILHVIPQEFKVDTISGIRNPIGMRGVRLEARVHIVTGSIALIQNLIKCVEQSGLQVEHVTLQPIASSEAVLTSEEKDMGVVLIDIGGGTTDLAVWKDGSLIHSQIIPVGGSHFTNDLAVALKISHSEAERVKVNHGSVFPEELNNSAQITVQGLPGTKPREVPLETVARVLNARADELFTIVKQQIEEKGLVEEITGGYVLTGGGALIKGMPELGDTILGRPTKIGYPNSFGGMTRAMQDPKYSTVLGLLLESAKINPVDESYTIPQNKEFHLPQMDLIGKLSDSLKSVFKDIF